MKTQKENIVNAHQTLILIIIGAMAILGGIILIAGYEENQDTTRPLTGLIILVMGLILSQKSSKKWIKNEKKFKNIITKFSIVDFLDADAEATISGKK